MNTPGFRTSNSELRDKVFFFLVGFADSFNLSVSAALLLQYLFFLCPEARGDMDESVRSSAPNLLASWPLN